MVTSDDTILKFSSQTDFLNFTDEDFKTYKGLVTWPRIAHLPFARGLSS